MKKLCLVFAIVWGILSSYIIYDTYLPHSRPVTARVDISEKTANNVPCFRLIDKNTGKELSTAGWMPKFGTQGYVFAQNGKKADLELQVASDNCKIDFSLRGPWELKNPQDRSKGLKEHWVEYTKFVLNGKTIVGKNTPAWHNKPIKHTLAAQKGDKITVNLGWQKYYTGQDNAARKANGTLAIIGLAFLFSIVALLYRFKNKIVSSPLYRKISKYQNFDLEQVIITRWQNISPLSKKSFLWIFLITNLVFLFHTVHFMWGADDWILVRNGMTTYNMLWCGRFTGGGIQQLFGGDLLPVINNLFCFAGFTFAVIYLAKYWKVPQTTLCYIVFGLFIILMPYTCSWLWHIKQTSLFWNIFFVIWALCLSLRKSYLASIFAIALMVFSLGAYASIISTIAIVFLGRVLMDIVLEQKTLKEIFKTYLRTGINIVTSVIIFKLILIYYDNIGKLKHGGYNTEYITLEDLPQKIKLVLKTIIELFYISRPDISSLHKLFLILPMCCFFCVWIKNKPLKIFQSIGVFGIILISGQLTNLMAKSDFSYVTRINFFSQPYIYALFLTIGLRTKKIMKSYCLIIAGIAIWLNILSDIRWQKIYYLGFKAENQIYTDIITRIKQNDNFSERKNYAMVSTEPLAYRKYFYKNYFTQNEWMSTGSIIPHWAPEWFYNFYEPKRYMDKSYNLNRNGANYSIDKILPSDLQRIADFILNKAQPYPHKNSVYVDDKYIYVIYDENGLNNAKRNIQARLKELENKHD